MIPSKKTIGRIISKFRNMKGYTQQDLADKLNILPSQLQKYEYGKNYPTLKSLDKLIKVLGMPSDRIFDESKVEDTLVKVDKRMIKYAKITEELDKNKNFAEFCQYYLKNKDKVNKLNYFNLLKELAKVPDTKKKKVISILKKAIEISK